MRWTERGLTMLELLAIRYLRWRGLMVLPRTFVGFAIGFGQAVEVGGDGDNEVWRVEVPVGSVPIGLNHSVVVRAARAGMRPVVGSH